MEINNEIENCFNSLILEYIIFLPLFYLLTYFL
jgi:hypothetical protein